MFVFHIGLAKTGTSTLQGLMAANRAELKARGIVYPALGPKRLIAHHELPQALKRQDIVAPAWEALRALRREAHEGTVLVSSEGFTGLDPHLVRKGIAGDEARVIVYVRSFPAWAVSAYCQRAKWGSTHLDFDEYLAEELDARIGNSLARLLPWAEAFGANRVRVRSLERGCLEGGDLIDDFLMALGTTREGLAIPVNVNETPDWRIVELLKEQHARRLPEAGGDADRLVRSRGPRLNGSGFEEHLAVLRGPRHRIYEAGMIAGARLGWTDRGDYLTREQRRRLSARWRTERERLLAALPDARIGDPAFDTERERPFLPSPEAVPAADRRAFEAAFAEALADLTKRNTVENSVLGRLKRALVRRWSGPAREPAKVPLKLRVGRGQKKV